MNYRHVALASITGLALIACTAATSGLGDSGRADESGSETDASDATDGNGEASEADADGSDAPGDGDPTTDDDDDDDDDESPTGDDSSNCGDGVVDPGEDCDGSDLDGMDCAALGFVAGELTCSASCSFNTAGCFDTVCGNGMVDDGEECDGMDLDGMDCVALGYGVGKPLCTNDCKLDTSVCPSPGEGESCGALNWCPYNYLSCVDGTCYDGSLGDPCNLHIDCRGGLWCEPWGGGTCQP